MVDHQLNAMRSIGSAASVVRAFHGSDSSKAVCAMLDALMDSYKLDLMHVSPENLVRLQACILQTAAIRNVVADDSQDLPKI